MATISFSVPTALTVSGLLTASGGITSSTLNSVTSENLVLKVSGTTALTLAVSTLAATFAGAVTISSTTASTSASTGALVVSGGVGIAGALFTGSTVTVGSGVASAAVNIGGGGNTGTQLNITAADGNNDYAVRVLQSSTASSNGIYIRTKGTRSADIALYAVANDGTDLIIRANNDKSVLFGGTVTSTGALTISSSTASTSTTTGSLINAGGFGNAGAIYNGGDIYLTPAAAAARYIILNGNAASTGSMILQAGAGSSGFGGGLVLYSHSHASKPGWVTAGISASSGGSFSVNSQGLGGGVDVFTVNGATGAITLGSASSITAASATDLTLAAGSSGASLVLGQGANGGATVTPVGTGKVVLTNGSTATTLPLVTILNTDTTSGNRGQGIRIGSSATTSFDLYRDPGTGYFVFLGLQNSTSGFRWETNVGGSSTEVMRIPVNSGNLLIGGTTDISGSGGLKVFGTTAATSTTSGALQVAGGVGVAGKIYVGDLVSCAQGGFTTVPSSGTTYGRWVRDSARADVHFLSVNLLEGGGQDDATKPSWKVGLDSRVAGDQLTIERAAPGGSPSALVTVTSTLMTLSGDLTVSGGNVGVGGAISTARGLSIVSSALASANQYGVVVEATFNSSATSDGTGLYSRTITAASAFTMAAGYGAYFDTPTIGSGSAITTQRAIYIANQGASGITHAYGIDIAAQSGAATTNVGLRNAGQTVLSSTSGTSAGGILFGTDVNLYRANSQTLAIDAATQPILLWRRNGTSVGYSDANSATNFRLGSVAASGTFELLSGAGTTAITLDSSQNAALVGYLTIGSVPLTHSAPAIRLFGNTTFASTWSTSGSFARFADSGYTATDTGSSGAVTSGVSTSFGTPTFASSNSVTIATAANVYIAGNPAAGSNTSITSSFGLWNVGNTRLDGGLQFGVSVKTADYTATNADYILVGNSATNITFTLPASPVAGRTYVIKNKGAGQLTVSGNGTNLFTTTTTASTALATGNSILVTYDGAVWNVW